MVQMEAVLTLYETDVKIYRKHYRATEDGFKYNLEN